MYFVKIWKKKASNNISIISFLNWTRWFKTANTQCLWNNWQCHVLDHAFRLKE